MSEAPLRIASTSTLLTNFTTGVSSPLASMPASPVAPSSSPLEISRLPKLSSSSPPRLLPKLSWLECHCSSVRRIWSSSTRIGSTTRLVWNLISSSEWVGLLVPTNSLPPRLNSGSTLCLRSSSSLTRLIAFWLASNVDTSNSGMPNSSAFAAANWAAPTTLFCANQVGSGCRAAAALAIASRAETSSSAPSCTKRRARPVMPTRLAVLTALIEFLLLPCPD